MGETPQKRALKRYRRRLTDRGMARFEVLALSADRELIRSVARRLAGEGPEAVRFRTALRSTVSEEPSRKGGILNALRCSPLVGAGVHVARSIADDRRVHL